ncbi:MAG: hypothetical protein ACI8VW_000102 [bacterium]|jgi:hypothetical protein
MKCALDLTKSFALAAALPIVGCNQSSGVTTLLDDSNELPIKSYIQ